MFFLETYTSPLLGPLVPFCGFLVTSPLGFKSTAGSALYKNSQLAQVHVINSQRSTSGASPANLLTVNIVGGNLRQHLNVTTPW